MGLHGGQLLRNGLLGEHRPPPGLVVITHDDFTSLTIAQVPVHVTMIDCHYKSPRYKENGAKALIKVALSYLVPCSEEFC
jgi:hypothetical protein